jgi:hypothetical protein
MIPAQRSSLRALFAIATGLWCASGCSPAVSPPPSNAAASGPPGAVAAAPPALLASRPRAPAVVAPRFDRIVSDDIFAGLRGDEDAMARGLARCNEALAKDALDPQPLMWHALATGFLGGKAYREGDPARGRILVEQGDREAEQAVRLAPNDVWVLVYYAMDHSARARFSSDQTAAMRLMEQATSAYEHTAQLQAGDRALSVHDRGELLVGLADLWSRRGDEHKARMYLTRATRELPGTVYATRSQQWLDDRTPSTPPHGYTCLSCHE